MHTIAIVNQKGGCGKTTTAINLAGVFAAQGFRTLLVDMDPQGHCAAGLAIPEQRIDKTIGDAMLAEESLPVDTDRLLWRVSRNLDLAPSTTRLAALEAARGQLASRPNPERRLRSALARFDNLYDVCLIDCSPAIGLLTFNSLVASREIIIPVETGFFSLQGATKQVNAIRAMGKRLGVSLQYRILPTLHDARSALSKDLLEEIKRRFPGKTIPVVIRHDVSLREAASFGQPVVEYAPGSHGSEDYHALAQWLVHNSLGKAGHEADDLAAPVALSGHADGSEHLDQDSPALEHMTSTGGSPVTLPRDLPTEALASAGAGGRAADMAARAKKMQQPARAGSNSPSSHGAPKAGQPNKSIGVIDAPTPPVEVRATSGAASASGAAGTSPFGVKCEPESAVFCLPASLGGRVSVAGEFNGWSADATPLRLSASGERWEATVPMAAGMHQYRLVVDGAWIADPFNPSVSPNPFGGTNSLLVIPAATSAETGAGEMTRPPVVPSVTIAPGATLNPAPFVNAEPALARSGA